MSPAPSQVTVFPPGKEHEVVTSADLADDDLPDVTEVMLRDEDQPGLFGWLVWRIILPLAILAGAVLLTILMIVSRRPPDRVDAANPAPLVRTMTVDGPPARISVSSSGTVLPRHQVTVSSQVKGKVIHKSPDCLPGEFVSAGKVLYLIDPEPYLLQIDQLTSEIEKAEANLQNLAVEERNNSSLIGLAEKTVELAQGKLSRAMSLRGGSSVTRDEVDGLQTELLSAQNALQKLRNDLATITPRRRQYEAERSLARSKLNAAQIDLDRCFITAPVNGIVSGEVAEAGDSVAENTALCVIQDNTTMEVRCELSMRDLAWLWESSSPGEVPDPLRSRHAVPDVEARVSYELGGRVLTWKGKLTRFEGAGLTEETRTIPCRIELTGPADERTANSEFRKPVRGMFVGVELVVDRPQAVVQVPAEALRPGEQVWRVRDGVMDVLTVEVSRQSPQVVLVRADSEGGLRPGDRVVVSPLLGVRDGLPVRDQSVNE